MATRHGELISQRESSVDAANAAWSDFVKQSGYRPGRSVALLEPGRMARDKAIAAAWSRFNAAMRPA